MSRIFARQPAAGRPRGSMNVRNPAWTAPSSILDSSKRWWLAGRCPGSGRRVTWLRCLTCTWREPSLQPTAGSRWVVGAWWVLAILAGCALPAHIFHAFLVQALANNLLSRAVQLSRHAAVGHDAAACCAVSVADLQLHQAKQMLSKGGTMSSLAAALLSSAIQQLSSGDLQEVAAAGGSHAPAIRTARQRVLALLCKAHLAGGEAGAAAKVLDALEAEAPQAIAADPQMQTVYVQAKLESGRVPEALRFLVALLQPAESAAAASATPDSFLAGLRLALPHLTDNTLPSFQSAANAFVWRFAASSPLNILLQLVKVLLSQDKVCPDCSCMRRGVD